MILVGFGYARAILCRTAQWVRFSQVLNIYLPASYCVELGLDREMFNLKPGFRNNELRSNISSDPSVTLRSSGPDPIQGKSVDTWLRPLSK
jgi:hypothetical protein